jgi:hypothetical protein
MMRMVFGEVAYQRGLFPEECFQLSDVRHSRGARSAVALASPSRLSAFSAAVTASRGCLRSAATTVAAAP